MLNSRLYRLTFKHADANLADVTKAAWIFTEAAYHLRCEALGAGPVVSTDQERYETPEAILEYIPPPTFSPMTPEEKAKYAG